MLPNSLKLLRCLVINLTGLKASLRSRVWIQKRYSIFIVILVYVVELQAIIDCQRLTTDWNITLMDKPPSRMHLQNHYTERLLKAFNPLVICMQVDPTKRECAFKNQTQFFEPLFFSTYPLLFFLFGQIPNNQ